MDSSRFVALSNNEWKLIDASNNNLTKNFQDEIYDYSNYALALHNSKDDNYYLADYAGNNILNMYFDKVEFYKNIILAVNKSTLYVYDSKTSKTLMEPISMTDNDAYRVVENTSYIDLYVDDVATSRIYYDGHLETIKENETE